MRIYEAAQQVMREANRTMHAKEVYQQIVAKGLFEFGAKDPVSIVAQTLRKKSDAPINKGHVLFRKVGQNTYELAD